MSRVWERDCRILLIFYIGYGIVRVAKGDDGHPMDPKTNPPGVAAPGGFLSVLRRTGPFGLCAAVMYHLRPTTCTGSSWLHRPQRRWKRRWHTPWTHLLPAGKSRSTGDSTKFRQKKQYQGVGFLGCIRSKVIVTQNIPTVTELLRWENTSIAVLFLIKSTAILVFFDSAAADRCSTLLSGVNEQPVGEADRWRYWVGGGVRRRLGLAPSGAAAPALSASLDAK